MYFKSIIGAIFTSLAVISFSANAALIKSMQLETNPNSPLQITRPNISPTIQQGQMTGCQLEYQRTLNYTSLVITPISLTKSTSVGVLLTVTMVS